MKRTIIIALSVVALVFGVISYATAAPPAPIEGPVTVTASVNSALSLTLDETTVEMGTLEPGTTSAAQSLAMAYTTNWANTELSAKVVSADSANITVNSALATTPKASLPRGKSLPETDSITALVNYNVDPGVTTLGTITYTLAVK
jgi:hypothetical protein